MASSGGASTLLQSLQGRKEQLAQQLITKVFNFQVSGALGAWTEC